MYSPWNVLLSHFSVRSPFVQRSFTVRSPFVHRFPFTKRSPLIVLRLSFCVYRSPFIVQRFPFIVFRLSFTVYRSAFSVYRSPFIVHRLSFSVNLFSFSFGTLIRKDLHYCEETWNADAHGKVTENCSFILIRNLTLKHKLSSFSNCEKYRTRISLSHRDKEF